MFKIMDSEYPTLKERAALYALVKQYVALGYLNVKVKFGYQEEFKDKFEGEKAIVIEKIDGMSEKQFMIIEKLVDMIYREVKE